MKEEGALCLEAWQGRGFHGSAGHQQRLHHFHHNQTQPLPSALQSPQQQQSTPGGRKNSARLAMVLSKAETTEGRRCCDPLRSQNRGWWGDEGAGPLQSHREELMHNLKQPRRKEMTKVVTELAGTVRKRKLELSAQQWWLPGKRRWRRYENFRLRKKSRWKKIMQETDEILDPEMANTLNL